MPFIGKQPQAGAYSKLDAITTSATATYNLTLDSGAYYPQSANHLLVSLNGVIQAPQDSFTVSGSQIIFDSALTSADVIDFIIALGDTLDIGVPSAGSVNTSQLANDAVTTAKIAAGQVTSAKLDTNIDVAGTLDVTGATTLDSTLAVVGNSTANSINLGGRTLGAGGTPLGVNFSSASTNGMQINDTNSGNLGGMLGFYSGSGTGTLRGNIQNANNAGIHVCVGTGGTVVFGNSGYTAANALDDYEEGTFTPTLYHTSTNDSTFSLSNGQYTKIGNTVTCQIRVDGGTSGTAGSFLVIGGLPFAVSQAQGNMGIGIWGSNPSSQVGNIHGFNPPRVFKGGQDVTTQMSFFTAMLVYKTS